MSSKALLNRFDQIYRQLAKAKGGVAIHAGAGRKRKAPKRAPKKKILHNHKANAVCEMCGGKAPVRRAPVRRAPVRKAAKGGYRIGGKGTRRKATANPWIEFVRLMADERHNGNYRDALMDPMTSKLYHKL